MSLLDPRTWLVCIAALAAAVGGGYIWGDRAATKAERAACLAGHQALQLASAKASLQAEAANREKEKEQRDAAERIAQRLEADLADARRAGAAADAVGKRLRQQVAQLAATAKRQSGAATSTDSGSQTDPAGSTALDLLANLHSRTDEAAGAIAAVADDARIRGLACERQYDAVSAL